MMRRVVFAPEWMSPEAESEENLHVSCLCQGPVCRQEIGPADPLAS